MKELGIYIHIPFCKSKCYYCDFCSFANKEKLIERYIKCLNYEIKSKRRDECMIKTIYIGGGTPSYIDGSHIVKIIKNIKKYYNVYHNAEITIEANPGTCNEKKFKDYREAGVNRLSIGLQTSNNNLLKEIGRIHTYEQYEETIKEAKKAGFTNINSDIMVGLPNQTIYDVEDTLDKLLKLNLTHISVYSLIVEENTKLKKLIDEGELKLPDDEIERYMYWYAKRRLEENGFIHYEISNFAKEGFASKHNLDCWSQKEYLGFGVNAASFENNVRYSNTDNLNTYMKNIEKKDVLKNTIIEEKMNKEALMNEYMMLELRKINGVNLYRFEEKFKKTAIIMYGDEINDLCQKGLIDFNIPKQTIKLTKKGIDFANLVWEEFI